MNHNSFASNRELFREPTGRDSSRDFNSSRDPPRAPKGFLDAPTGPRASSQSDFRPDFVAYRGGDYRSDRGRGRGRGGWREDSRDRGRELDREYRDRRDDRGPLPRFGDDRGRDRWGGREPYRGRRASSPQGRGRSPNYGPRDNRDAPPNIEIDRARRGSRDGPLSGGSPGSDSMPPFRGYGRASRGGRGRGRGGYYEDGFHGRPSGRSRSPEPTTYRRTQPSATPPPQVPAFGSSASVPPPAIPSAPSGAVPGVAIPTAPRSDRETMRSGGFPRPAQYKPSSIVQREILASDVPSTHATEVSPRSAVQSGGNKVPQEDTHKEHTILDSLDIADDSKNPSEPKAPSDPARDHKRTLTRNIQSWTLWILPMPPRTLPSRRPHPTPPVKTRKKCHHLLVEVLWENMVRRGQLQ